MAAPKSPRKCWVRIGSQGVLMPAKEGMQLVSLLQSAVDCDRVWIATEIAYCVEAGPSLSVEFALVDSRQIHNESRASVMARHQAEAD
jgi:hypothetical protein